mmetsp:Transcript_37802/g.104394  ORF Transcript_37802/g.104394 Transcript_37802/m.104394 type:complete len:84 (-) Transcript_37802:329-580(-)
MSVHLLDWRKSGNTTPDRNFPWACNTLCRVLVTSFDHYAVAWIASIHSWEASENGGSFRAARAQSNDRKSGAFADGWSAMNCS